MLSDSQNAQTKGSLKVKRRDFLKMSVATALTASVGATQQVSISEALGVRSHSTAQPLPRWRGFNLLEKLSHTPDEWAIAPEWGHHNEPFRETDFEWIAAWGFNFVRLAMSYKCWTDPRNPRKLLEKHLKEIDQAVEYGRRYGIHVSLNFCRAPGYYIQPHEPNNLWSNEKMLDLCAWHWRQFAQRYKGIPGLQLSFDLINEPNDVSETEYIRVIQRLVKDIREEDPGRFIMAEGINVAQKPVPGLAHLGVIESAHCYWPSQLTHYKAPWAGYPQANNKLPTAWPIQDEEKGRLDREALRSVFIAPWQTLAEQGVSVHVGEFGCYRYTPHEVALAWMRDLLDLIKEAGWGWALWSFRGSFGILDSGREDVKYEDFRGHKLDRKMLELLREH